MDTYIKITPDRSNARRELPRAVAAQHASIQRTIRGIKYSGDARIGRIEMVVLECLSSGVWVAYRQAREVFLMFGEIGIISTLFLGGTALETMTPTGDTLHMTTIRNLKHPTSKEDTTP